MFKENEKILIFNGSEEIGGIADSATNKIQNIYPSTNVDEIKLRDIDIKPCVSCFNCWVKTPGKCMIDEHANMLVQKMLACDKMIWITDILFGTYCYTTKKMMDRMIQIGLPFFKCVKGETRHYDRYGKLPGLMIVGLLREENQEDKELFKKLVARNRLNYTYQDDGLYIVNAQEEDALDSVFGVIAQKEGA